MNKTLTRELKVREIAALAANGSNALVEVTASGCGKWVVEREICLVCSCSPDVAQLENQLLCIREDASWLMLSGCEYALVSLGIQACVDC